MNTSGGEDLWQQYAGLIPELHAHIRITQQHYRGQRWYLLKDDLQGGFCRFNETAYQIIQLMDGSRNNQQILEKLKSISSDTTEQDIIAIVQRLQNLKLIKQSRYSDAAKVAYRAQQEIRKKRSQKLGNPLAVKFPLLNPDALLDRLAPRLRFLLTPPVAWAYAALFLTALYLSASNSQRIKAALSADILEAENLLLMTGLFVLIKILHEFSHALAVKIWGGHVREMGISLLVLAPIPYVDASAAWEFRDKRKRILVSAMGILSELFIASVAILLWLSAEPGSFKTISLNVAIVASVSTVAFNANPLLKFDGYYMLQDYIEIPNLYNRSKHYVIYLAQRYLLGAKQLPSPAYDNGERVWFVLYAVAAFCYRLVLLLFITLLLIKNFLIVGVALATWSIFQQLIKPIHKSMRCLVHDNLFAKCRTQAIFVSFSALTLFAFTVGMLPLPSTTESKGIVWVPDQAEIYSPVDSFLAELLINSGTNVSPGMALLRLESPQLAIEMEKLHAKRSELLLEMQEEWVESGGKMHQSREFLSIIDREIEQKQKEIDGLIVRSQVTGEFIFSDAHTKIGQHLKKGDFIAYVFTPNNLMVKSVFSQIDIGKIRESAKSVEVRLAESLHKTIHAKIARETPASTRSLPSKALGVAGGGEISVGRDNHSHTTASEDLFNIDFALNQSFKGSRIGGIAYVRVQHAPKTLARQVANSFKQNILHKLVF